LTAIWYLLQVGLSKLIYQDIAMNLVPLDSSRQGAFAEVKKLYLALFIFNKIQKKKKKKHFLAGNCLESGSRAMTLTSMKFFRRVPLHKPLFVWSDSHFEF
jgi:hypothetical protein